MYEPVKSLGQNFLTDVSVAQRMVEALNVTGGEDVIEIGAGLGVVTEVLGNLNLKVPFNLYAVEIDQRFIPKLEQMFAENLNVHVLNEDVLKFLPKFETENDIKVIGSLPFNITSPIVHSIVKMKKQPSDSVIMIQKEVAQKIVQTIPDASYLSTFVQTFFDVELIETVPRNKFSPVPDVDAIVIALRRKQAVSEEFSKWDPLTIEKFESFLHRGFSHPRKMLNKVLPKDVLESVGVSPTLRPQNIDVATWLQLFEKAVS